MVHQPMTNKAATNIRQKMRLAISGGGPAGLTLAGILSREGNSEAFDITVFERNTINSDQGSGWDIIKDAQDSLTRAGLNVASIQRKESDTFRFYKVQDEKHPVYCMRMPSLLSRFGIQKDQIGMDEANLETDRTKLVNGLTASLGPDVKVNYESYISGARRNEEEDSIELLGHNGSSLGEFDLIVDASGARSPLRNIRFSPKADAFYTGTTIIQYLVNSPEKSWDKDIVDRLGEGSLALYGKIVIE